MKDIDKMSSNELRAEVRVLRAVVESFQEYHKTRISRVSKMVAKERIATNYKKVLKAIVAVEALDEK